MKTRTLLLAILLLAAAASAYAADLPTAEELQQKVAKAYATMTSFEADIRVTFQPDATEGSASQHLAMEKSAKGDKTVEKASWSLKGTHKDDAGNVTTEEGKNVNDGTFSWEERRHEGEVQVRKYVAEGPQAFKLSEKLGRDAMRIWMQYNPKTVAEDTVDGRKMYVLEGAFDQTAINKATKIQELKEKIWVGQDDSIVRRVVRTVRFADKDQPWVTTTEWLNMKVNEKVDPALFVYAPPEGAKIDDRTQPKP